ncbi:MAG: nucleotidyltransferase domain-containing protein [Bacilli bacterium]|nr:nucleotidyltransferase domain-containing protein [Bacilli bacterium]
MEIKEFRKKHNISLNDVSKLSGVPLRTLLRYENDNEYGNKIKREYIQKVLTDNYEISEDTGIYNTQDLIITLKQLLSQFGDKIHFCYLFGSYAKNKATPHSDIDIVISTSLQGLDYVAFIGTLYDTFKKHIDVIKIEDLVTNVSLLKEVMKDGIKVYG